MNDFRKIAKQYIDNGYWVIPCGNDKRPSLRNWTEFQTRPMTNEEVEKHFKKCANIALLCGGKPRVELLDWDLKHDISGDFYDRVKSKIPEEIKRKMFVQTSRNLGFHWLYKTSEKSMHGNQKLASRYVTANERHQTYLQYYKNPSTRDNAMKIAINDTSRVLAETRGGTILKAGGYGLINPSEGYEVVYSPKGGLQELTDEEHEALFNIIRSFNEVKELDTRASKSYDNFEWVINPFDHFNESGDALELLYESGWEEIGTSSKSVRLKRPGATSGSSALYDIDTRLFNCFSTSTKFDCNKTYNPVSIFIELECDGNASEAYKKLISLGFGEK